MTIAYNKDTIASNAMATAYNNNNDKNKHITQQEGP